MMPKRPMIQYKVSCRKDDTYKYYWIGTCMSKIGTILDPTVGFETYQNHSLKISENSEIIMNLYK